MLEGQTIAAGVVSTTVKVAVLEEALPQASVAVKITVAEPVLPQRSESEVKLLLQETPEQTSDAVAPPLLVSQAARAAWFPLPSHSTVAFDAAVTDGLVVSTMVKVAVLEEALPQASLAVKITVAEPVLPHRSESEVKLLLQETPEQISDAVAPPLEASHAASAAWLPLPSHSTVAFDAAVIDGLVVSTTVKVAVLEEALPQASVAVKITVAEPVLPQRSESEVKLLLQETPEQTSDAVAPPLLVSQAARAAWLPLPSHSTVEFDAAVIEGLVVSTMVKVAVVEVELPLGSEAVKITEQNQ